MLLVVVGPVRSLSTSVAASGLPLERGGSSTVGRGRSGQELSTSVAASGLPLERGGSSTVGRRWSGQELINFSSRLWFTVGAWL